MPEPTIAGWKHVVAFFIDLVVSLLVIGGGISLLTGDCNGSGFSLNGLPALLCFAGMIAYFVVGNRLGGTLGKRIFSIPAGPAGRRAAG